MLHDSGVQVDAAGIERCRRAHFHGDVAPTGRWIEDDDAPGAGCDDQRFCRQPDGTRAKNDDIVAWQPVVQAIEQTLIRHAGRLDHGAHDQRFFFAIGFGDLVQLPAIFCAHGQILRHRAIDGEADFFDIQAVIDETAPTGCAYAAPLNLLDSHQVANAQVAHSLADLDDAPGEFVPQDIGRADQARVDHIAIGAGFVHVHVAATDAHRRDLQHDLVGLQLRVGRVTQREARVFPDHVGVARATQIPFAFGEIVTGLGRPVGGECQGFHFATPILDQVEL